MIRRIWPKSLQGQMLLAVALALLFAQGFGALLIYRAQTERQETAIVHTAAFRLLNGMRLPQPRLDRPDRSQRAGRPDRPVRPPPHYRFEITSQSPIQPNERRDSKKEELLRRILADQDFPVDQVEIVHRRVTDDPRVQDHLANSPRHKMRHDDPPPENFIIAAVHRPDHPEWLVARVLESRDQPPILHSLLAQTIFLYLVVVGAIAFILRRLTRSLAALTNRVERFANTRDPGDALEPEGPDDVRRLIIAHNKMEARISALLDEKDVMLGAIGHDLKTPLAALRVRIESVEDDDERAKMATTIEDIVSTLDDILSLARVGRPSDPLEQSELSALVGAVVDEFEDMGENVTLGDTQRIVLPLRATWLRRALRNLIENGLRYGKAAHVSVARNGQQALITIDDEGPGIPEEDMIHLFEPFSRGDPSRNSETGGSGLGLTLARAIADQHGGSLELSNRRTATGAIAGLRAQLTLPLG